MALATFQGLHSHMWLVATVSGNVDSRKFHWAALQLSQDQPPPPTAGEGFTGYQTNPFRAELVNVY